MDKEEIQEILDRVFEDINADLIFSNEELEAEAAKIDEELKDAPIPFIPPGKKAEILENLHQVIDYYEEHKEEYEARK